MPKKRRSAERNQTFNTSHHFSYCCSHIFTADMALPSLGKAVLLLEDGTALYGIPAGKIGTTTGEICFNTGMTGYQEVFTDPSYSGQILIMTADHIGNYGAKPDEAESSRVQVAGIVMKNFTANSFSRKQAEMSLHEYLLYHYTVGICEIDTRALVRHIRHKGAMNAVISSETDDIEGLKRVLASVPNMSGLELSSKVSTSTSYLYTETGKKKVAVLDLGIKRNILRCFDDRDVQVKVFPAKASVSEMHAWEPDGYFISNGPGDPEAMPYAIETARQMIASGKPVFGICMGHQILALAHDIPTYKMFNGHRGLNHPVKNLLTGRCEITSQNHGFSVNKAAAEEHKKAEITHIHLNDQSIAGLRYKDSKVFSVQYHPESSPGPQDSRYLFDDFIALM